MYISISELQEILNPTGQEWLLVTDDDDNSSRIQLNTVYQGVSDFITSISGTVTDSIIDDVSNFVHANAIQYKAIASENILKGEPVKIIPNDSDIPYISKVQNGERILGIAEFDMLAGDTNTVIALGVLNISNTFTEGKTLYSFSGSLIDDESLAKSLNLSSVGYVLSNGENGKILVKTLPSDTDLDIKLESLFSSIGDLNTSLNAEISRAQIAETNLQNNINNVKLQVLDEGVSVAETLKINFIGTDVNSFYNELENRVDVFIPSAKVASHFNTNDGDTDASINKIITTNRYIGNPIDGSFSIGNVDLNSLQSCINNNVINYKTNEKFLFSNNSKIKIELFSNNTVIDSLTFLTTEGNFNSNGITCSITNMTSIGPFFTANFNVSINLSVIGSGVFDVKITNIEYEGLTSEVIYTFEDNNIFIDGYTPLPSLTFDYIFSNISIKHLSGVKFYTSGTSINYNNVLFDSKKNSYPDNLLDIDLSNIGFGIQNKTINDFENFDNRYNTDISFSGSSNIGEEIFLNGLLELKSRVNDWDKGTYEIYSQDAMIDTYHDSATRVYEDFVSETYRLKTNDYTIFDSTLYLEQNELQVIDSKLCYPQNDFSRLYDNPDYSQLSGDRSFIRKFWHDNVSHSNGIFNINTNIVEDDILSDNIKIEISLDGINWFNLGDEYTGGILQNGDGCRIFSDINNLNINNKIEFTLGLDTFTDSNSNWGIYCKITIKENFKNKYLDTIEIINW